MSERAIAIAAKMAVRAAARTEMQREFLHALLRRLIIDDVPGFRADELLEHLYLMQTNVPTPSPDDELNFGLDPAALGLEELRALI